MAPADLTLRLGKKEITAQPWGHQKWRRQELRGQRQGEWRKVRQEKQQQKPSEAGRQAHPGAGGGQAERPLCSAARLAEVRPAPHFPDPGQSGSLHRAGPGRCKAQSSAPERTGVQGGCSTAKIRQVGRGQSPPHRVSSLGIWTIRSRRPTGAEIKGWVPGVVTPGQPATPPQSKAASRGGGSSQWRRCCAGALPPHGSSGPPLRSGSIPIPPGNSSQVELFSTPPEESSPALSSILA